MSVDYLIEIFGGTGAVVLGIATCIWRFCKTHEFKWDYDEEDKKEPAEVLNEEWENRGENFSIEEDFGSNWNRLKFAIISIYIYIFVYLWMCICMYVCIYIYIHPSVDLCISMHIES